MLCWVDWQRWRPLLYCTQRARGAQAGMRRSRTWMGMAEVLDGSSRRSSEVEDSHSGLRPPRVCSLDAHVVASRPPIPTAALSPSTARRSTPSRLCCSTSIYAEKCAETAESTHASERAPQVTESHGHQSHTYASRRISPPTACLRSSTEFRSAALRVMTCATSSLGHACVLRESAVFSPFIRPRSFAEMAWLGEAASATSKHLRYSYHRVVEDPRTARDALHVILDA